jgi:peroxiredoxin
MTAISIGKALPKATLKLPLALSGGETATLADHAGQWLVLYFYPKDSTPGCTTEGLDFNALLPKFKKLNRSSRTTISAQSRASNSRWSAMPTRSCARPST